MSYDYSDESLTDAIDALVERPYQMISAQGNAENEYDFSELENVDSRDIGHYSADREYDPVEHFDKTQQRIAYSLIGLLAGIFVSIFVTLWFTSAQLEDLDHFNVLLSPVITLVSAATGFYFGSKKDR